VRYYIDSSAAAKLILLEAESVALAEFCNVEGAQLTATDLVETELRRLAIREGSPQADVTEVLAGIDLYPIPRSSFYEAGLLDGRSLRSLDALHLTGAIRFNVDAVLTYDARLGDAAVGLGLAVAAPGAA
jgi:hypothetical protein